VRLLELEVGRHFGFEEAELFPRLEAFGAGDIGRLLRGEHDDLRALAGEMLPLLRAAGGAEVTLTAALRQLGAELVERQISHIQKETMGLLPLVDDLLDDEADRQLAMAYAEA
jgi:hemerythrin-like domain-containing protein